MSIRKTNYPNIMLHRLIRIALPVLLLCGGSTVQAQWQQVHIPPPYNSNHWLDVYFLPSNPNYGWICGFRGFIIRTTDGGENWQGSSISGADHLESVDFPNEKIGYVSGPAGVFKSEDGGVSWRNITPAEARNDSTNLSIWGSFFYDTLNGIVVGGGCDGTQNFFRTTDGGGSWKLHSKKQGFSGLTDAVIYPATGLGYVSGSGWIWRSLDTGFTWDPYKPTGETIWHEELTHIGSSFLLPMAGDQCNGGGGPGDGAMLFSNDGGDTWRKYDAAGKIFGAFLINETTGWGCGWNGEVLYTEDAGQTWARRNCGIVPTDSLDDMWFITPNDAWVVGNRVYRANLRPLAKPQITAGGPLEFCEGGSVELVASEGFDVYRWSNGARGRAITVNKSGRYTLTVTDKTGCLKEQDSIDVEVHPRPRPAITSTGTDVPGILCAGESMALHAPPDYVSYTWSTGETGREIMVSESGIYSVMVIDSNGCQGTGLFEVRVTPNPEPRIIPSGLPFICRGESLLLSLNKEYAAYNWSTGEKTAAISVSNAGNYSVEVWDEFGCHGVAAAVDVRLRRAADYMALLDVTEGGVIELESRANPAIVCRTIEISNSSTASLVIGDAILYRNIRFSVPRSQFPLLIPSGGSRKLEVCYAPEEVGTDRDTLLLPEYCFPAIPLRAASTPLNFSGLSNCDVDISVVSGEIPEGGAVVIADPYPNPGGNEVEVHLARSYRSAQHNVAPACLVYDFFGRVVARGTYRYAERRSSPQGYYESGAFIIPVGTLPQGIYTLSLRVGGAVESRSLRVIH